jgi:isopentenyldiphosphate isomerase
MDGGRKLDVVDATDTTIGQEDFTVIHTQGLPHREVHVWFITPTHKLIFQRRSLNKSSYPGLLDATVGGHVEIGDSYEQAALREVEEEAGLNLNPEQLIFLGKFHGFAHDLVTGTKNNTWRSYYLHIFAGKLTDLKIEAIDGAGFEVISLDAILKGAPANANQIIPTLLEAPYRMIFEHIAKEVAQA